ncbi:MAG: hypothetical protein M1812_005881 [Candelaria pacifica]|nr:MAG: hypothetical protein M1812_005881 [Candelaria pacifica]
MTTPGSESPKQSRLTDHLWTPIVESHEVSEAVRIDLHRLQVGDFEAVLTAEFAESLLRSFSQGPVNWSPEIRDPTWAISDDETEVSIAYHFTIVGLALFNVFIQSNITGPPLPTSFSSAHLFFDNEDRATSLRCENLKKNCHSGLAVDGVSLYPLIANIELFCAAHRILNDQHVEELVKEVRWPRLQANFLHQRMLSEATPSLQEKIYEDLKHLEDKFFSQYPEEIKVRFLLERAAINAFHGFDSKAREDLDQAARGTGFQFALTGLLGKRTKFQQKETSQLVVLAKSNDADTEIEAIGLDRGKPSGNERNGAQATNAGPTNLDLNDDTLLESISFSKKPASLPRAIEDESSLPSALTTLDPSNQPLLKPLDSIILLSLASSITNTSPADGLTRENTLPYATRVLEGGSSNWQIYTQALLVRSRIEGYRSRTVERGVLQLQALVDQVIVETTPDTNTGSTKTTFLPKPKPSETASATERLQYVHQLCSPTRWELEAELAARWVSLGSFRTALEIYERLQMWTEAALCWAGVDREDKAVEIIRKQLFHSSNGSTLNDDDEDDEGTWEGPERDPPPPNAPRLYCILGDIDESPSMYERAWSVSNNRYSRAQRSLGRHYFSAKDYPKAAEAYEKSLHINRLNHPTWFALGCVRLELQQWDKAVDAFSRTVQLDDQDAEAWSNLAAALLRLESNIPAQDAWPNTSKPVLDDEDDETLTAAHEQEDPQRHKRDALAALSRASRLLYTSYRIWENLLIVAASLKPPSYTDVAIAQKRLIDLRGSSIGEKCIDEDILQLLVRHIITSDLSNNEAGPQGYDASKPGLQRMVVELVEKDVIPLITTSSRLWLLVAKLALWRNRPSSALAAHEKAWRAVISQPGWEVGTEKGWEDVVDATIELVDAYESLGDMQRTEGLGAGDGEGGGEVVARDWRFKARSAVRGILGRGKGSWEGTGGWERLVERGEGLKVSG